MPLLADPQWGLLYPGHWLFLLMPGPRMFTLINAMHVALLGVGIFAWVRMMNPRHVVWRGGGGADRGIRGMDLGAIMPSARILQVAAWMPVMLLCYEQYQKNPKDEVVNFRRNRRGVSDSGRARRSWRFIARWGLGMYAVVSAGIWADEDRACERLYFWAGRHF